MLPTMRESKRAIETFSLARTLGGGSLQVQELQGDPWADLAGEPVRERRAGDLLRIVLWRRA